jgi:hypothetical protein
MNVTVEDRVVGVFKINSCEVKMKVGLFCVLIVGDDVSLDSE